MSVETGFNYLSYLVNVVVVAGWILLLYRKHYKRRLLASFFGENDVALYFPVRDVGREFPVIAHEDFAAASNLRTFLVDNGIEVTMNQIMPDSDLYFEDPKVSPIVICGPKSSDQIGYILESDPKHRFFEQSQGVWGIEDRVTGNVVKSPMDTRQGRDAQHDIAYLGRLKYGRFGDETFILIAGVHAVGSLGVVHFVRSIAGLRKLNKETKGGCFSTVVTCAFSKDPLEIRASELLLAVRKH